MLIELKMTDLILIAILLERDADMYDELSHDPSHGINALRRAKDRRETKLLITKAIDDEQKKKEIELGLL